MGRGTEWKRSDLVWIKEEDRKGRGIKEGNRRLFLAPALATSTK